MKPYPAYKDSGIAWLGKIPEGWQAKRIKYFAKINPDVLLETTDENLEIQYIDIGNVTYEGLLEPPTKMLFKDAPSRARRILDRNDVIISTVRTYLKAIAFIDFEVDSHICSTGFAVLRALEGVEPSYLYYVCLSEEFIDTVSASSVGVSYPAINSSELASIHGWIPTTLPEQKSIANYLDRKTQQIDQTIASTQTQIQRLKEYRTALISEVVTGKVDVR